MLCADLFPFNSRPHKEADIFSTILAFSIALSIHDLTRRSTAGYDYNAVQAEVFQFTTSQGGRQDFESLKAAAEAFQFTTSQGGRQLCINAIKNDGTFQFTTSQGGRPLPQVMLTPSNYTFNSRPHKEVDPASFPLECRRRDFQFTTSQGGRHGVGYLQEAENAFNSRPHKEVDAVCLLVCNHERVFQFTTSQGGQRSTRAI